MLLTKTTCSTDYKGRPSHQLVLVARTTTVDEAKAAMDRDVVNWMASDVAISQLDEQDEDEQTRNATTEERVALYWSTHQKLTAEISTRNPADILSMWEQYPSRWEVQREIEEQPCREFVLSHEEGTCTLVYHMLNDDMSQFIA